MSQDILPETTDTELPVAAALADGAANPTTPTVGSGNLVYNGTTWDRARGDTTNGLDVDVTRVQGTVTVSGTVTSNAGTGTRAVAGDVASGSSDSGNPVKTGGVARTADPTAVTAGQRVNHLTDTLGKQVVLVGSTPDRRVNGRVALTNTTASDVIAAQGAGIKIAITAVMVTNAHATVSTKVEIRDGTTVRIIGFAKADGGGFVLAPGSTPLFTSTANTAVTARCVTTGSDIEVFCAGYTVTN